MKGERPLAQGVLVLIITGTALGIAHNLLGLASHPPRGIAWLATSAPLPKLTALVPDSPGTSELAPADTVPPERRAEPGSPGDPARAGRSEAPRTAPAPPAVRSDTNARTEPAGPAKASLPVIAELDHPVEVDLATVKRLFDARAALFLDARDPPEYEAGHIPGARRLTRNDALAEPERLASLPGRERPIVTYCEGGACEASLDLARTLVEAGFRRVLVFTGGMPEWAAAGHPIERGSAP